MLPFALSTASARAFDRLGADLARIFESRLEAVVAYSRSRALVFVRALQPGDLDACSTLVESWHGEGLATPLLMTSEEFRRSLDAFPLEYQAILDRHQVISGQDPFAGIRIAPEDLRRACETEARGHVIHLRQGWLEAAGHDHEVAELMARSAGPWRVLLTNVARLHGAQPGTDADLAAFAAKELATPDDLTRAVLALDNDPDAPADVTERFADYLAASERLWHFVDAWRSR
jgi:hypothetical protein